MYNLYDSARPYKMSFKNISKYYYTQNTMQKHILVICSGNTCRSPMAAELIRMKGLTSKLEGQIVVESRGIRATEGEPASKYASELFDEMGGSLADHRSQRLKPDDLEWADIVLVMTHEHRRALHNMAAMQMHKVYLFSELKMYRSEAKNISRAAAIDADVPDIDDPYGQSKEVYHATLLELKSIVEHGWQGLTANPASPHQKPNLAETEARGSTHGSNQYIHPANHNHKLFAPPTKSILRVGESRRNRASQTWH